MHTLIGLAVIGFLKQLMVPILAFLAAETDRPSASHVDIDSSNFAVVGVRGVNRIDGLENVRESFLRIRFSGHQQDAFVPLASKDFYLAGDFGLC